MIGLSRTFTCRMRLPPLLPPTPQSKMETGTSIRNLERLYCMNDISFLNTKKALLGEMEKWIGYECA